MQNIQKHAFAPLSKPLTINLHRSSKKRKMKPKNTINKVLLTGPVLVLFLLLNACSSQKMDSVPETESERFAESLQTAPLLVADPTHRNIALNRPAEHS